MTIRAKCCAVPLVKSFKYESKTSKKTFVSTGLAALNDACFANVELGLGVLAVLAEDKLLDVPVENVLQFGLVMGAIDDVALVGQVNVGLGAQLNTEVFCWV